MSFAPLLPLLLTPTAAAGDWPWFLGPDRSGVVEEADWSAVGAAEPVWSKNVGLGYSCPSIVDGRLFTLGYDADEELDRVLCLDADSGDELWRVEVPSSDAPVYHGGGTLTTPAVRDGVVYVVNRHGLALALSAEDGAERWARHYGEELGLERTFHGFCASPVVLEERIVYLFGGQLVVVERDGGDVLWRSEDAGDGAYTNPTVFELEGRTLVAVMLAQDFRIFDLDTGAVRHELPWPLDGNAVHVAQPLVVGDRVLLSTAYGKGAAMLRLGEAREPEVLWATKRLRNKVTGVYLHDEHLYGFDESMLKCFDLEGNEQWRVRGLGMGALSIAGGRLLVLSSKGELIVAEATPEEFRELSRNDVLDGGSYWTMPVLVDGLVYVRNSLGDLACLDYRGEGVLQADASGEAADPAPSAAELFTDHAARVGAEALRAAKALHLSVGWEILGRGMESQPASLLLEAPNRWRLALDSGLLEEIYDGEICWQQKNGGYVLHEGTEAEEAPRVLALAPLLAPQTPDGATVFPAPVIFEGVRCWRVDSTLPATDELDGAEPLAVAHYFDVESGALVGREGDALSTTVFAGSVAVGEASVPARITIFRAGSGQEETLTVSGGTFIEPEAEPFARPPGLQRLLRTPEQRAADTARLRREHGAKLGTYVAEEENPRVERFVIDVVEGDLVALDGDVATLLTPVPDAEHTFRLGNFGVEVVFTLEPDGSVPLMELLVGPERVRFGREDGPRSAGAGG